MGLRERVNRHVVGLFILALIALLIWTQQGFVGWLEGNLENVLVLVVITGAFGFILGYDDIADFMRENEGIGSYSPLIMLAIIAFVLFYVQEGMWEWINSNPESSAIVAVLSIGIAFMASSSALKSLFEGRNY